MPHVLVRYKDSPRELQVVDAQYVHRKYGVHKLQKEEDIVLSTVQSGFNYNVQKVPELGKGFQYYPAQILAFKGSPEELIPLKKKRFPQPNRKYAPSNCNPMLSSHESGDDRPLGPSKKHAKALRKERRVADLEESQQFVTLWTSTQKSGDGGESQTCSNLNESAVHSEDDLGLKDKPPENYQCILDSSHGSAHSEKESASTDTSQEGLLRKKRSLSACDSDKENHDHAETNHPKKGKFVYNTQAFEENALITALREHVQFLKTQIAAKGKEIEHLKEQLEGSRNTVMDLLQQMDQKLFTLNETLTAPSSSKTSTIGSIDGDASKNDSVSGDVTFQGGISISKDDLDVWATDTAHSWLRRVGYCLYGKDFPKYTAGTPKTKKGLGGTVSQSVEKIKAPIAHLIQLQGLFRNATLVEKMGGNQGAKWL